MSEEAKDPEPKRVEKKAYQPPVLVEYGSIAELTKGKHSSGSDMLSGAKR
jgi:hypothetical protein